MEKSLHLNKVLILLLFVSVAAMGQYTGGGPNAATFKTATASATAPGLGPELAVDSSEATFCSITGTAPSWIMVDLGAMHYINGYGLIVPNATELPRSITLQTSEDGLSWIDIKDFSIAAEGTVSYNLPGLDPVQYVRFYITNKDTRASISEVLLYGYELLAPSAPVAEPATNISSTGFTANWNERTRTEGYTITLARDIDFFDRVSGYNNIDVGNVTSLEITGLDPATTYFYRTRAYNVVGTSNASNVIETATLKTAQTITFDALADNTYGDADFDLVATASSGLPVSFSSSADSIASISGTTLTITGAGTVSITAIQEGDATYDTAAPVTQDLVVSAKELTVTGASAVSKVYDGTADAEISGAVLNGVIATDDVSLAGVDMGLFAQSDVGTAIEVTASFTLSGADSANYSLVQPDGLTADITEKELVITAGDYSREACEVNPDLDVFDISGFVDGEDETVMTESPVSSCDSDESSAPGTYEVSVSGGAAPNYTLTLVNGTLTVTPDVTSPTLSVQAIEVQLDEGGNASITPADLVVRAVDNCAVSDTTLSQDTFTTDDIGNVNVEVTVSDAAGNTTSEMATVTVIGFTAFDEWSEIEARVYPNPTNGKLELIIGSPADVLKVMDMTGKTVIRKTRLSSRETLDLSEFSNGIYVLQLQSGQVMKHIKVIKK
ncbi:MAG: YDG domain-containing protein [Bacteroidota bacterium]